MPIRANMTDYEVWRNAKSFRSRNSEIVFVTGLSDNVCVVPFIGQRCIHV